ncbi:MAG TPA: alpha-L-fucosidase, partial [Tepidisphaeraceae bacterium]|nr:alpha-L-fucosidase [Tepidisphaeraceae bacterium]
AQCVPEQGDWYGRLMYMQGEHDYDYQVAHYGHPSKVGFKEIDHLWHADNWDPEKLMQLYKRAGAKYFVALANHHDNFDCYDSKYQPWNSVNIGPHKDIVGIWAKIARENGLRFAVSVHAAHAWSWFEVAQGSDKTGPLAGVPYDGKLTKADGKGTWWEGLDPQDLYAQNHLPGKQLSWDWKPEEGSSIPDKAYCEKFFNRTVDLINKYSPDAIYFDDTIMPLNNVSDVGLRLVSHFYNSNIKLHGGKLEAVVNTKGLNPDQRKCVVWDIERGLSDRIQPQPWQTDTCIGQWHYDRSIFEKHEYKTPALVIGMLADIVSKNGNLLLSIPVRGDGSIDDDEIQFLHNMSKWMDVNSECIFGTRPFTIFGEGPIESADDHKHGASNFNEGNRRPLGAKDIRFTTKGDVLYAIVLGWPDDGKVTIHSLAKNSPNYNGEIASIELLGSSAKLQWKRDENALTITLPNEKPCEYAIALKIRGK